MGASSPSAFMLWSILACLFQAFYVVHLYYYDKFQCIKWSSGRQPGAFKRVMTYSYLATVPLLMVFSLSMTIVAYKEGYLVTPDGEVIARPITLWSQSSSKLLLPMFFVLAAAWALELVTHLEELTFWLFLIHQGPQKRNWFQSWEFRVWYLGSMAAVLGMPIAVLVRRRDMETCLAWIYFSGSSAGTVTTLCFIYVLVKFPAFIHHVKSEGAEPDVVVRLATFYQLNIIRIVFRFLFNFSLLSLALDGIQGPHNLARNQAASDLLAMLGGIGCFVSSAITFLIFFPRSITRESGYRAKITHSVDKTPTLATSHLPDYYRHDRGMSSPKSQVLVHQYSVGNMNSFRFPNNPQHLNHEAELGPGPRWQRESTSSYGGEATPQYESDPENVSDYPHQPRHRPVEPEQSGAGQKRGDTRSLDTHEMWEVQSEELHRQLAQTTKKPKSNRERTRGARQREIEHDQDRPPLWEECAPYRFGDATPPDGKVKRPGTVVLPQLPRIGDMMREEPSSHSNRSSSVIHPYVMNFTSPIDLLDNEDDLNVVRAI